MSFLAALQFLTVIPVPRQHGTPSGDVGRSLAYFTVVGLIIGLIMAGWRWVLGVVLPPAVANVLVIASLVVITGAMHLDGFLDTCDGLAGHKSVEERWQVMHDSRAGGFGAIGVACLLLVEYISLNSVPESLLIVTLVLAPVLSRWAVVFSIFAYPYARPSGLGKAYKEGASWLRFTLATLVAFVAAGVLLQLTGIVIMAGVWVITVALASYLRSKFAGLTGDTYGAINEIAVVFVFIFITLLSRLGLA